MQQFSDEILINTKGEGFTDITNILNSWIKKNKITQALLVINCKHTSCSLIINENADPNVLRDLSNYMKAIVPEIGFKSINDSKNIQRYLHSQEGVDDMPAHIRTALTSSHLTLSIKESKLNLGTWQAIYIWEHRYIENNRKISLHSIGDTSQSEISKKSSSINNIMMKTNAKKLNNVISENMQNMNLSNEDDYDTQTDLLIDRIHDLSIEED